MSSTNSSSLISDMEIEATQSIEGQQGGLFALPPKIRNRIYELLLTRQRNLRVSGTIKKNIRINNTRIFPGIVNTCRQFNKEATPVLYGANGFELGNPLTARIFLTSIGSSVKYIRHIELTKVSDWVNQFDWSALTDVTSLKKITIRDPEAKLHDILKIVYPIYAGRKLYSEKKKVVDLLDVEVQETEDVIGKIEHLLLTSNYTTVMRR